MIKIYEKATDQHVVGTCLYCSMGSDNYLYDAVYGSANAHKISADRLKELYIKVAL